jgi:hypothetical protein
VTEELRLYVIWRGRAFLAVPSEEATFGEVRQVEQASGVTVHDWPRGMFGVQVEVFVSVARVDPLALPWDELTAMPAGTFVWVDGVDEADALARLAEEIPDAPQLMLAAETVPPVARRGPGGSGPREVR